MSIDNILNKNVDRREFLEGTGKAAVGLAGLLSGCASTLKETKQDVAQIKWDCNPILTIPAEGCYTGTNERVGGRTEEEKGRQRAKVIEGFEKMYGITPTFSIVGWGKWSAFNHYFPQHECEAAVNKGVIPVIQYVTLPFKGYKEIIEGTFDKRIAEFAQKVEQFKHPVVIIPYELPNDVQKVYEWAEYPPSQYEQAWIRIHNIFSKAGANKNSIWSTKLKVGAWDKFQYLNPFPYIPPEQYFDIIGWAANNHCKPELGLYSQSLESLFTSYYNRARKKYRKKPQILWEMSTVMAEDQAEWLDEGLNVIENNYPGMKGLMFDVVPFQGDAEFGVMNPTHTPESIRKIRQQFSNPYFIGSAVKK